MPKLSKSVHRPKGCKGWQYVFSLLKRLETRINTFIIALRQAAKFRAHNRFPVLCWYNKRKKASMTRCSQPMVGLMQMRSAADEALIKAISDANPSSKIMYIIDCRAWVNAVANTARGAGTEKCGPLALKLLFAHSLLLTNRMAYYPNCRQFFMNIDNIHAMRDSLKQIADMCRKKVDYRWFSTLEAHRWLLEGKGWLDHTRYLNYL